MTIRLAAVLVVLPFMAEAGCLTAATGAGCVEARARPEGATLASASVTTPAVAIGQTLDRGAYSILMNAEYYGLPPVSDGWVYMRVERDVFRVDWRSHEVLERVTDEAAANF